MGADGKRTAEESSDPCTSLARRRTGESPYLRYAVHYLLGPDDKHHELSVRTCRILLLLCHVLLETQLGVLGLSETSEGDHPYVGTLRSETGFV
jgi:hypothetical protein